MPSIPEDEETAHLLARAREERPGSSQAWVHLLERCGSRLRILARFRTQTEANLDVDDVLQEVWIEAANKIHDFEYRGSGSLQRWLSSILHYKLLEARRSIQRQPFPSSTLKPSDDISHVHFFEALSRTQPGVSQNAQRNETEQLVRLALEDLKPEFREAILLRIYEGLNGREAGERLGISESAFFKRFRNGIAAIRLPMRGDRA